MTTEEYRTYLEKKEPKPPKFRNEKKIVGGIPFDSAKEARRYNDLLAWQHSGQITKLETQRAFDITINGIFICDYVSDFTYLKDGKLTVEDTKSKVTRKIPVYRLKLKLMKAVLGIEIQEV